jgi:ribosomal protein S17
MYSAVQSQCGGDVVSSSTRKKIVMRFQKSQFIEVWRKCLTCASTDPIKNVNASPPAQKVLPTK